MVDSTNLSSYRPGNRSRVLPTTTPDRLEGTTKLFDTELLNDSGPRAQNGCKRNQGRDKDRNARGVARGKGSKRSGIGHPIRLASFKIDRRREHGDELRDKMIKQA